MSENENIEQLAEATELTAEDALPVENAFDHEGDVEMQMDYPREGRSVSAPKATVDAAADVAVFRLEGFRVASFAVVNSGAAGAAVTFWASLDGGRTFDVALQAEVTIAAGGSSIVHMNGYVTHVKVRARSAVAGAPTTVVAKAAFRD